jgi:hypothetical protein
MVMRQNNQHRSLQLVERSLMHSCTQYIYGLISLLMLRQFIVIALLLTAYGLNK